MADSPTTLLAAEGDRVRVSPPTHADLDAYRDAVERSARRIGVWNPVNAQDLVHHLAAQSDTHRTFLVRALEPNSDSPLVGVVNVTNVVRGRFMSATMGYNAFDPYAGTGMFGEGLRLVVDIALRPAPVGMALHRVEANVRIGNSASAGLLRSLGFRRERTVRRMLWLADGLGGPSAWRDHDSYAVTREEWPAPAYAAHDQPRGVLVLGGASPRHDAVATALARELLGTPLVDVPFEVGVEIARRSAAPVVWLAGDRADEAVDALSTSATPATRIDREVETTWSEHVAGASSERLPDAKTITRLALAVRPYLA